MYFYGALQNTNSSSLKTVFFIIIIFLTGITQAEILTYDVILFGKSIGRTTVERTEKNNGEIHYRLVNNSEVTILLTKKSSHMQYDIVYKDGKLLSSYAKNVKDGITEIVTTIWDGAKYIIKKGEETLQLAQQIDFSSISLYFYEPINRTKIFSERMGQLTVFTKTGTGVYECKTANGVTNIYRYQNGKLVEIEMSKGASVFMRLVQ